MSDYINREDCIKRDEDYIKRKDVKRKAYDLDNNFVIDLCDINLIPSAAVVDKSLFNRAKTLLKATYELLNKQVGSYYVLNILAETVFYDGTECDGSCLMEDIDGFFWEIDGKGLSDE